MSDCIAVFETTHETLRAEEFFRAQKVPFRPVLRPRGLGASCRMALRFAEEELEKARKAVAEGNLVLKSFHRFDGGAWVKI
ncbi:MAG: DUF3343 domain-containing protein [Nitrospinae bacterium]|nr:DUF3343 domain-containing protein [Nitrospinota bacterium]